MTSLGTRLCKPRPQERGNSRAPRDEHEWEKQGTGLASQAVQKNSLCLGWGRGGNSRAGSKGAQTAKDPGPEMAPLGCP